MGKENTYIENGIKVYTLTQESGDGCTTKLTVKIPEVMLALKIRDYFRWRKGDMIQRLYQQGTTKYDQFIEYLVKEGYGA